MKKEVSIPHSTFPWKRLATAFLPVHCIGHWPNQLYHPAGVTERSHLHDAKLHANRKSSLNFCHQPSLAAPACCRLPWLRGHLLLPTPCWDLSKRSKQIWSNHIFLRADDWFQFCGCTPRQSSMMPVPLFPNAGILASQCKLLCFNATKDWEEENFWFIFSNINCFILIILCLQIYLCRLCLCQNHFQSVLHSPSITILAICVRDI